MYKKFLLVLICCMNLMQHTQALDAEFFSEIQDNVRKMGKKIEHRVSSFFDEDIDAIFDSAQNRIDTMRTQFSKIQQQFVDHYKSFTKQNQLSTIQDNNDTVMVTINVGDVETDMIENHLERDDELKQDILIITLPKNKPTLKIAIHRNLLGITVTKFEEKEKSEDTKITSHIISSRTMHFEQNLPATVVTNENVNIVHSIDDKTLTIELPKKTHVQQFSVKKK